MATSLNCSETPYFKNNSVGVDKGMFVRSLDFYAFSRTRYHVMTLATKDVFFLVRYFILGFILNKAFKHFIALFFRRHPKRCERYVFTDIILYLLSCQAISATGIILFTRPSSLIQITLFPDKFQHGVIFFERSSCLATIKKSPSVLF
jgi:hypothetical protein